MVSALVSAHLAWGHCQACLQGPAQTSFSEELQAVSWKTLFLVRVFSRSNRASVMISMLGNRKLAVRMVSDLRCTDPPVPSSLKQTHRPVLIRLLG